MEDQYCRRTGEVHCKCLPGRTLNHVHPLKVDLKAALRKLFTDHAVYTAFVLKAIVDGTADVSAFSKRLIQNQKDIGDQLAPLVGAAAGQKLTNLLTEHIKLAAATITAATKKSAELNGLLDKLFKNSNDIAAFLTSLNQTMLPYDITSDMFRMHNQFVVDMTLARIAKNFEKEQTLYDAYYAEILEMSDAIFAAL